MNEAERDLARYLLAKAWETLSDAGLLLREGGTSTSVINRLYYASFYAVSALLLLKGLTSKKHSGIRSLFNKHLVQTGLVSSEAGAIHNLLYDARQDVDYGELITYSREEAESWAVQTEELLKELEPLIQKECE